MLPQLLERADFTKLPPVTSVAVAGRQVTVTYCSIAMLRAAVLPLLLLCRGTDSPACSAGAQQVGVHGPGPAAQPRVLRRAEKRHAAQLFRGGCGPARAAGAHARAVPFVE